MVVSQPGPGLVFFFVVGGVMFGVWDVAFFIDIPLRTLGSPPKTYVLQVQNQSSIYRVICRICLAYISLKNRGIAANHAANRWRFGVILPRSRES